MTRAEAVKYVQKRSGEGLTNQEIAVELWADQGFVSEHSGKALTSKGVARMLNLVPGAPKKKGTINAAVEPQTNGSATLALLGEVISSNLTDLSKQKILQRFLS